MRQGVESLDPEVHVRGIARSIKRNAQWNMVARNFDRHTVAAVKHPETGANVQVIAPVAPAAGDAMAAPIVPAPDVL